MSAFIEITSEAEFSSHLSTLSPFTLLVLYFYTPWTEFCTEMSDGLSTLASRYQNTTPPTISFVSINGKELTDIARKYNVSKAPCVTFLRGGHVLESIRGSDLTRVRDAVDHHGGVNVANLYTPPTLVLEQSNDNFYARLTEFVKAAPVVLFMKGTPNSPRCRFSRHLVGILREHNIDFDTFDVLADENVRQGLKEYAGWPTFPQLWAYGKLVGGLDVASLSDLSVLRYCGYIAIKLSELRSFF